MKRVLAILLILLACLTQAQVNGDNYTKQLIMIPMRDGVKLATVVYVPKDTSEKHPILMERTPYGAGPYDTGFRNPYGSRKFSDNHYIFAYQDVRGKGRSEGEFENIRPIRTKYNGPKDTDESTDTYDMVEYLVKNIPNNNGRVGVRGISYPGFYAGAAAINTHPALKAASPQAPVSNWWIGDDFHHNGVLFLMDGFNFLSGFGRPPNPTVQMPSIDRGSDAYQFFLDLGPLANANDKYLKNQIAFWNDMAAHESYDDFWRARALTDHAKNVHCAVMTVGGWFDAEDLWGALNLYKHIEKQNKGIHNTLVMGPWPHGGWAGRPGDKFGDIPFGMPASTYYQENIEWPFFDAYLRGDGNPSTQEAQVFETGANQWHTFDKWPPKGTKEQSFYLSAGKTISTKQAGSGQDEYVSDPANPVPYVGKTGRNRNSTYMDGDQRFAEKRADVLTFKTEPMTEDLTIVGPVWADLFVTSTSTDADFVVKVIDVFPDDASDNLGGYEMLVRGEIMRAKFRNNPTKPSPLTPGKIEKVSYALPDVFHTFKKGHRMMVQVQSSWFPLGDRNPQKFMDIWKAKAEDFTKATIQLHHSSKSASRIRVGVLHP